MGEGNLWRAAAWLVHRVIYIQAYTYILYIYIYIIHKNIVHIYIGIMFILQNLSTYTNAAFISLWRHNMLSKLKSQTPTRMHAHTLLFCDQFLIPCYVATNVPVCGSECSDLVHDIYIDSVDICILMV